MTRVDLERPLGLGCWKTLAGQGPRVFCIPERVRAQASAWAGRVAGGGSGNSVTCLGIGAGRARRFVSGFKGVGRCLWQGGFAVCLAWIRKERRALTGACVSLVKRDGPRSDVDMPGAKQKRPNSRSFTPKAVAREQGLPGLSRSTASGCEVPASRRSFSRELGARHQGPATIDQRSRNALRMVMPWGDGLV